MIDDNEGLTELVQLQGRLVVSFVRFLIQKGLFKNDSQLRNLGLVVALWVRYFKTQTHPDLLPGPRRWYQEIIKLADEHSLEMYGPWTIGKLCIEIRENVVAEEDDPYGSAEQDSEDEDIIRVTRREEIPSRKWGFIRHVRPKRTPHHSSTLIATQFSQYAKKYRRGWVQGKIGGDTFDITKLSKADRDRRRGKGDTESTVELQLYA